MPMPRKQDPEKYCEYCGEKLSRKTYNGTLEDMARFEARKYCNQKCAGIAHRKENPTLAAYRKRSISFREDCCQECKATENIGSHHLDGNPKNNCKENIVTLCGSCHTKLHWQNGKKPYKRQLVCKICGKPARKLDMCQMH